MMRDDGGPMISRFVGSFASRLVGSKTVARFLARAGSMRSRRNILRRLRYTNPKRAAMKTMVPAHHLHSAQGTRSGIHEEAMVWVLPGSAVWLGSWLLPVLPGLYILSSRILSLPDEGKDQLRISGVGLYLHPGVKGFLN